MAFLFWQALFIRNQPHKVEEGYCLTALWSFINSKMFQDVNCHDETVILPKVLQMRHGWSKSQRESMRLAEAGMSGDVLDSAFSVLILVKTINLYKA